MNAIAQIVFNNKHMLILKPASIPTVSFYYPSTYRQLLSNEFNGGLESSRATSGFILHSFDCFQQRCHIGDHHLKHTHRKVNTLSSVF